MHGILNESIIRCTKTIKRVFLYQIHVSKTQIIHSVIELSITISLCTLKEKHNVYVWNFYLFERDFKFTKPLEISTTGIVIIKNK